MVSRQKILAYVLKNAIEHDGKARLQNVINALFVEGLKREEVKHIVKQVQEIIEEVSSMAREEQEERFRKLRRMVKEREKQEGLPKLPNVKGKPIFRLAPYPSGALHIGNAKTYLLNALYAEKYKGKLLLVMDDTIGSEEKKPLAEAYELIIDAFHWLGVRYEKPIIYKSDRLEIYYEYAEKLIELGKAYVCSCDKDTIRKNREAGKACNCRNLSIEENMERWHRMFDAKPGELVLRLKTDMQHRNPAFRDRILFRISDAEHPRVGKKYRVWPLLEFSWAIDDYLLGITHIIRGKDLMMESEMERFIWDVFGWQHPEIIHVGLVRIEGIGKIGKSKAQQEVLAGKYKFGWDTPLTWSVQSLRRRGILAESLREFVFDIGLNQNDIVVPIEKLYAINRKHLDKRANRYFFVPNPVEIEVENMPDIDEVKLRKHPEKNKYRKIKPESKILISEQDFKEFGGKEVRLIGLFNIKLGKNKKASYTGNEIKDIRKIQWVPASEALRARVLMPNAEWQEGVAEKNVEKLKVGEIIQFERFGFCRFDRKGKQGMCEFWFAHR